jgi:hypothetical protein
MIVVLRLSYSGIFSEEMPPLPGAACSACSTTCHKVRESADIRFLDRWLRFHVNHGVLANHEKFMQTYAHLDRGRHSPKSCPGKRELSTTSTYLPQCSRRGAIPDMLMNQMQGLGSAYEEVLQ